MRGAEMEEKEIFNHHNSYRVNGGGGGGEGQGIISGGYGVKAFQEVYTRRKDYLQPKQDDIENLAKFTRNASVENAEGIVPPCVATNEAP